MNSFIAFLKFINSMPFPFTMRHYQIFGESTRLMKNNALDSGESWDALRADHPFFSISPEREEWLAASEVRIQKDGQDSRLIERARDIAALIKQKGTDRIFSVGVGGAALEYQLKKLIPDVPIVCSDYSEVTVDRLRKVFIEADGIIRFDALNGDWAEMNEKYMGKNGLCIMYRIDASFSDAEWKKIFRRIHGGGIAAVLYIPTGTLTFLSVYNRKSREIGWFLRRIPAVFSGYIRTRKRFEEYWKNLYGTDERTLGGLKSFLLIKK